MNDPERTIQVRELSKTFGAFTAVDRISFDVRRGEIFGFLGPNGSGKTTTIRMILGLLRPTSGEIHVLGQPVTDLGREIRPRVGYMSQRFSLYDDLTVQQNLTFYGRAYGLSNAELRERMAEALDRSGLAGRDRARTGDLSGGWRQRLALSAAILHRPEMLFLDEPTAGVDPLSRRAFWDLLYRLVEEGVTVFVTTHYMDEAEHCHRLAFIQRGRLIALGSPDEIRAETFNGQVLELAPEKPAAVVAALRRARGEGVLPVQTVDLYGDMVHVVADDAAGARRRIRRLLQAAGLAPGAVTLIEPTLEDVFIACMRNDREA